MNAETAGHAGMPQLKQFHMVNIKIEFPRGISDQVISDGASTEATSVHPDPGLKPQATSLKQQASSNKLKDPQATSDKHQAPSSKRQA